jgi:hypothetical protein
MALPEEETQPAGTWILKTFGPFHAQERFLFYGTGGLMDPKNYTVEPYVLSGSGSAAFWTWDKARWASFGKGFLRSQSIAFFGVGVIGAIFDPLGRDDDAGLDEVWGDIFDWGVPRDMDSASRSLSTWAVERSSSPYWYPGQGLF